MHVSYFETAGRILKQQVMAQNKTTQNTNSVRDYLDAIPEETKRSDFISLVELISATTGMEAGLWGDSIVGFGSYRYKYESGLEGDAALVGLAARKNAITIYLCSEFPQKDELLQKLGKHKTGKGCIYIQKLKDIDTEVLSKMVTNSIEQTRKQYPSPSL